MTAFVIVWSLKRGALKAPELLDDENQWRAFSAWREAESRDLRVAFECSHDDARVIWKTPPARTA